MAEVIVRPKEAARRLGIGMTKLGELEKTEPSFPKRRRLSERAVGFIERELDEWILSRPAG